MKSGAVAIDARPRLQALLLDPTAAATMQNTAMSRHDFRLYVEYVYGEHCNAEKYVCQVAFP